MRLTAIDVQGFKSFADKTTLRFGEGITAVVGPNGSGKSNISDAVRWVLGEQSTRNLRGQSMEDVIFNGTASRKPHTFAEVTLHIDNSDRLLPFDNDDIAITRRYYRSHESEYLINRAVVRLKDVHELFMDTGVGRDGYSMVGQGKIDQIISAKSEDRRDMLEEAAGISRYRYRKQEAERKLALAQDNLLRLQDILQELESRIGPLQTQSQKAEKFLELAKSKRELEIGLWLHTLEQYKDNLQKQEGKITAAAAQYRQIEQRLTALEQETEACAQTFRDFNVQIDAQRRDAAALEETVAGLQSETAVLENNQQHNAQTLTRLKEEKAALSASDAAAQQEIEAKKKQAAQLQEQLEGYQAQAAALQEELSHIISQSEDTSRQIEAQVKALNVLSSQSADSRVRLVTAQSAIAEIEARAEAMQQAADDQQNQARQTQASIDELRQALADAEERITAGENARKGYEMRLQAKQEQVDKLTKQFEQCSLDRTEKERHISLLQALERNMEGYQHSVKEVVQQAKGGLLRGVHGPISRLIRVPDAYATAVETALGGAIQNIVVERDQDAKRAIEWLKVNKKGRATFLPVSTIRAKTMQEPTLDTLPGIVGVASSLVEVDAAYRAVLESLLGRTIVAEDLDCALKIAKQFSNRYKVVTLDGQVVNPGGSLTGGSLTKNAGMLSRANEIERLKRDVGALEQKQAALKARLAEAATAFAQAQAEAAGAQSELTTALEDRTRFEAELRHLEDKRQTMLAAAKSMQKDMEAEQSRKAVLAQTAAEAQRELEELAARTQKLQGEVDLMSNGRDDAAQKRQAVSERLTQMKLKNIETQKDIDALLQAAAAVEQAITDRLAQSGRIEAEMEKTLRDNAQIEAAIAQKALLTDEAHQKRTAFDAKIADLQRQRDLAEQQSVALRAKERELTADREKIGGELARLEERKTVMIKEYDDIINRLYDEYELTRSEAEATGIQIENLSAARSALSTVKNQIRALGTVNVSAIEEYKEVSERYTFLSTQIADVEKAKEELYKLIESLTVKMRELFLDGFQKINERFGQTFTALFGGGAAQLRLSDPAHVLDSGVEILVRLPGKNTPSIEGLSGGERALVAISIYFAIMQVNPAPFCFLDEVDSALDEINVERFAAFMKSSGLPTQFICITHRRGTMECADMLYGVTMQEKGVSKLLSLPIAELERQLKLA